MNGSGQGDVLDSGSGQDIVIVGSTIYDNNLPGHCRRSKATGRPTTEHFYSAWPPCPRPRASRGGYELSTSTVTLDDGAGDAIDLGSAYDWLFWRAGIDTLTTESEIAIQQTFIRWDVGQHS